MTQSQLIKRVEELERDMREIKERVGKNGRKSADDLFGLFRNDRDFQEAAALGESYRRSQRPGNVKRSKKR